MYARQARLKKTKRRIGKKLENGLWVFDVPPDSPKVTTELVKKLEAEQDFEDYIEKERRLRRRLRNLRA